MSFVLLAALVGFVAGSVASVAGFGIGSLLTPLLGGRFGVKAAVALVSLPHFAATVLRAWRLRREVDRRVLWQFGLASAAAGLVGALLQDRLGGRALGIVFGGLLVLAGVTGALGLSSRVRFGRRAAWIAGLLSGALGGLVGNQGGIRSAALFGFDVRKEAFVATATAIGVVVDLARVPVYVATQGPVLLREWRLVAAATAGALVGTLAGERVLRRVPERWFRLIVSLLVLALGVAVLAGVGR
jgi:uncharacterized membrane protein YfcA